MCRRALLSTLFPILLVSAVTAQSPIPKPPISIYAGGGYSMPQSKNDADLVQNGFHAFAGLGLRTIPLMTIGPRVEFTSLPADFAAVGGSSIKGGDTKIFSATIDSRVALTPPLSPIKPFLTAGDGVASIKQDPLAIPVGLTTSLNPADFGASQTKLTWSLGAGIDLSSSPMMSIFLQGRYLSIQTEGAAFNYIPISLGLRFF